MTIHRRRPLLKAEMNVIPFLDVLLVLLLVMMSTAPMVNQIVQVELPSTNAAKSAINAANSPVILEIAGAGRYTLIIQGRRLENLSQQQVVMQAKSELQQDPRRLFLIGGSATVAYEEVIKGLNLVKQAGVTTVGLMTQML